MNDFDYDVMQKKRIARGAYARKGTTNRKGCRLPHENLTKKELEKLNGEVTTISMMTPIQWGNFYTLPSDLQEEYLDTQVRRFGVGLTTIGRELFGFDSDSKLANYVRDNHLTVMPAPPGRQPKAARESWLRWLDGGERVLGRIEFKPTIAPESETTPETTTETTKEVKPFRAHDYRAATQVTMCEEALKDAGLEREDKNDQSDEPENIYPLTDLNMTLKGTPIDILATLRMSFPALLDKDKTYRFTIKADTFVISPPGKAL